MNYVLAVSGGVDSVALLDMAVRHTLQGLTLQNSSRLVVAHFDHGIRPDSDADARFVWELAKRYSLPFEVRREELGSTASEATARQRRYEFLRFVAEKYDARIVTAHHRDDVIETIAINLERGTGWRGLAAMANRDIVRPLLGKTKAELRQYACEQSLEWIEDETNMSDSYLRNHLRRRLARHLSPDASARLYGLWRQQSSLKTAIDEEAERIIDGHAASRYFFIMLPDQVALELLRHLTGTRLTRPQLRRLLHGIKTASPNARLQLGASVEARFSRTEFSIETPDRVL